MSNDKRSVLVEIGTTGPLNLFEEQILKKQTEIEEWFSQQWKKNPPPIYGSVDLRNAGFKLAPIDMNLFPGGFNNLNPDFLQISINAAKKVIQASVPYVQKILLIPESHTRNLFYWENVQVIVETLAQAGFEVKIGSLLPDYQVPTRFTLKNNSEIEVESVIRDDERVRLKNFIPDLILLNNDLSDGIPEILQQLKQPIMPPAELGWSYRLKSEHFQYYADVSDEFGKLLSLDPWLFSPLFRHCGELDFMRREGEDCLAVNVEQLFRDIKKKYEQYDIHCNPFIIVKADRGTYGMAVMTVRSVDEIHALNRRQRTHMSKSKGGKPVHKVIIQEGVYTFETVGEARAIAEPVVYLWGECVVGGFYRVHQERGIDENLNSPGMKFEPLPFIQAGQPIQKDFPDYQSRFYVYGVIARLSMLAAAREMQGSSI